MDIRTGYGAKTDITITLNSLATSSTAGRESTAIDNTSNKFLDALVTVILKVATGTIANDKCAYVYAYAGDGVNLTDNATGSDAAVTFTDPKSFVLIGVVPMPAQSATYEKVAMSVAQAFGGVLPPKWGIVVQNYCGINLDSSGNSASYVGVYAQSA